jgi:hypothetical protein
MTTVLEANTAAPVAPREAVVKGNIVFTVRHAAPAEWLWRRFTYGRCTPLWREAV